MVVQGCASKAKAAKLPPLLAPSWRVELEVPGFEAASLALPLGATTPRPIAVVLHGAGDRAEWQCGSFRGVLGGGAFVLCPQGLPLPGAAGRYTLGSPEQTAVELRAALGALKARFGAHVAPSPVVLIGYAEGAAQAADIARQEPAFFARVALLNGNPIAFTPTAIANYAKGGGKRVLFACTDVLCQERAQARATLLTRAGAPAKASLHEVGPWLDARFTQALSDDIGWLLEGDPRWAKR